MSREIKFRQLVDGNWYEFGWLEKDVFTGPPKTNKEKYPTVQYTGLTDKNGTPIYEGDIVEVTRDNPVWDEPIIENEVVEYVGARFKMGKQLTLSNDYAMISIKVIGNIHQHPELLEQ